MQQLSHKVDLSPERYVVKVHELELVAYIFNPSTRRQRKKDLYESETSLIYIVRPDLKTNKQAATRQPKSCNTFK